MPVMSTNSFPVRLLLLLFLLPLLCECVNVYVDNSGTNTNCHLQGSRNNLCNNLTLALEYIHDKNDSMVQITNGEYDLIPSSPIIFQSVENITIAGDGMVKVICQGVNAGLTFRRSSDINIRGIHFSGCGSLHNSTSRNFSNSNTSILNLLTFNATLYFEGCSNVVLDLVNVTESPGIAVQFYATTGKNMIIKSRFENNPNNDQVRGGGVYIEFPYCQPGNTSCKEEAPSVDISTISNSQYIIRHCAFSNNSAISSKNKPFRLILPSQTFHDAFDRGGGLSIVFKGNAGNNTVFLEDCLFEGNSAVYGGGLYVELQDSSYNNNVSVCGVNFTKNAVTNGGGGMFVRYLFLPNIEVVNNAVELENVRFECNTANSGNGGGLSYSSTSQGNVDSSFRNSLSITNSLWESNKARIGAAVYLGAFHPFTMEDFYQVNITNSKFVSNSVAYPNQPGESLGSGTMYIDEIPVAFFGSVIFDSNDGTALTAYHTTLNFSRNTASKFTNNEGYNGGAIALYASSYIIIGQNTSFAFIRNEAANLGGAIYAQNSGEQPQKLSQNCFIQYYYIMTAPKEWMTHVKFLENSAGDLNNSIYSFSIQPCLLGQPFGVISDVTEAADKVFCWNENWDYGPNTCQSEIRTSAAELTVPPSISVIPGKRTFMNLNASDDQGHDANHNLVTHAYSNFSGVEVAPGYKYTTSNYILLYKKTEVDSVNITINTIGQQGTIQNDLVVYFQECPPGFILDEEEGICVCLDSFGGRLKCDQDAFTAELLRGFWIGPFNNETNETLIAHCPNCNFSFNGGYLNLTDSLDGVYEKLCKDHSKGRLCSTCIDGYAPAINFDTFKCVNCSSNYESKGIAVFILVDICCPIIFLLLLYWIDVPLTNGLLHGPIFFAQMITTVISLDADDIIQYQDIPKINSSAPEHSENVYTTIYDIFNLEFFMYAQNVCLPGVKKYIEIITLYYFPAFIPMILVFVLWFSYYIYNKQQNCIKARCINVQCQPYKWCKMSFLHLPERTANVLALFILLSYAKIAVITGYLLTPVVFFDQNNNLSPYRVVYLDGSVDYFSEAHLPYFVTALAITFAFLLPVPIFFICFRFNDPKKNDGFFNYLLYQFQRQFRNGPEDFHSKTKELNESMTGKVKTLFNRHSGEDKKDDTQPHKCCGIYYSSTCCKSTQLCSLTTQKFCCFTVQTSCSPYDYRWLSGGFFVLQIVLLGPYVGAWNTIIRYIMQFFVCTVAAILIIIFRPYKMDRYPYIDPNIVEAVCLILLAILIAFSMYQYTFAIASIDLSLWAYIFQSIIVYLPLCWIVIVFVVLLRKQCRKRWRNLKAQEQINDYVLFEIANSSEFTK